jgi:hypothetical protein
MADILSRTRIFDPEDRQRYLAARRLSRIRALTR